MKKYRQQRRFRLGVATPDGTPYTEKCLYQTRVGFYGREMVCMTPRRHLHFFGGICRPGSADIYARCPPERLGCGTFACAYPHKDSDKIVKFTRDTADIVSMRLAGPKYGPRLYEYWQMQKEYREKEYPYRPHDAVYALVTEKLRPAGGIIGDEGVDDAWLRTERPLACVKQTSLMAFHQKKFAYAPKGVRWKTVRDLINEGAKMCCSSEHFRPTSSFSEAKCQKMVADTFEVREALRRRGVEWTDIKPSNIGWSSVDHRWKALDLGYNEKQRATRVPSLRGGRR